MSRVCDCRVRGKQFQGWGTQGNRPFLCWHSPLPWAVFGIVSGLFLEASANLTFFLETFLWKVFISSLPAVKRGLAVRSPVWFS